MNNRVAVRKNRSVLLFFIRERRRELVPRVMIGDDQVDAFFASDVRRTNRRDAAVDGDDQFRAALITQRGDRLRVQAVAFFYAVGDVVLDLAAEQLDRVPEHRGGGDAVDVV